MRTSSKSAFLVTLAVLLSLVAGCSSWTLEEPARVPTPPLGKSNDGWATVCVIRTAHVGFAVIFPVRDNDALVGATRGPTYFCYLAEPGEHALVIESDTVEGAVLTAESNGHYFLHQEVDNIFGWVRSRSSWVSEEVALRLLRESNYEVLVRVPASERLPAAPARAKARPPKSR